MGGSDHPRHRFTRLVAMRGALDVGLHGNSLSISGDADIVMGHRAGGHQDQVASSRPAALPLVGFSRFRGFFRLQTVETTNYVPTTASNPLAIHMPFEGSTFDRRNRPGWYAIPIDTRTISVPFFPTGALAVVIITPFGSWSFHRLGIAADSRWRADAKDAATICARRRSDVRSAGMRR